MEIEASLPEILLPAQFKALAEAAGKQVLFHDSASEAYKESSPYKRNSAYSDALAGHCKAIVIGKLQALGFESVSLKTKEYVKPDKYGKMADQLGIPAGEREAFIASLRQAELAAKTPAAKEEGDEEEVA